MESTVTLSSFMLDFFNFLYHVFFNSMIDDVTTEQEGSTNTQGIYYIITKNNY